VLGTTTPNPRQAEERIDADVRNSFKTFIYEEGSFTETMLFIFGKKTGLPCAV